MKPTLQDIECLMKKMIIPFYAIERDMALPVPGRRNENDAEHSWSLALLACSLAPHIDPRLDVGTVCQFAIVHDLVEVFAQDTSIWADQAALTTKEKREAQALEKITNKFSAFPWIATTIAAYEQKTTDEANFVWAVDKLIGLVIRYIDQGKFFQEKGITLEKFNNTLIEHRKKAHAHPGVALYYDELRAFFDAHPEYFSQ